MSLRALPMMMLALGLSAGSAAAAGATPDCTGASTQAELDACASGSFAQADAELNRVWRAIQSRYADQPLFLARLKTAQKAWLAFRDAEVAARFPLAPGQSAQAEYGSVFPMCQDQFKAVLTAERTAQLKAWLEGVAEGDVCAGSVKPAPLP
ncbi:MAG: DUF1311 domain-containing protein [Xanthomonadaceae bacterium]|nr:DUF1311 domain-containing protein [Xanthomonadaceae bacterium]MDE1962733.1 DUF1311 domain-containing protein [Xanthomonadaceae bacterium]